MERSIIITDQIMLQYSYPQLQLFHQMAAREIEDCNETVWPNAILSYI